MNTVFLLLIIFFSCILQGITGFGFALLAAPLAILFYDQQSIVVILMIINIVLNGFLFFKIKTNIDKQLVGQLIISGLIGITLGILILTTINADSLKLFVGILALIFGCIFMIPKTKITPNSTATKLIGLLTGILQSSVGLSGPPIVLLLTGYGLTSKEIRKTLAVFFFVISAFSLPLFFLKNILTWERIGLGILSIPLVLLGGSLGDKLSIRVPQKLFRIITMILVLIAGLQVIIKFFIK